ncbi:formylglycine-generating enzyme family protein [Phormidium tenue]|jgi:formylglycine-generating enzyme required for sulfatase activity|uniref:SUMF1/EgtB/PvdO family nonheme iron enzyme n=1 Tax=Phormidium tenue FACHB-1050 TaxID=2692857 RepID=A0ABR8C670_9CYAN|nr:SUMF1/EgtB/PvdO family nonheme iron enzyme [Phormidium tenue]MBD2316091.1 SUMF1/EgtB/PvdO family nonheme iron enzyme [Phormidium tenue FACHB-1050]
MEKKLSQVFSEYLGVDNFLELVHIPEGKFVMGTAHNEEGYASERPSQLVKVSSFYLGKFPITQRQWQAVAKLPEISIPLNPAIRFLGFFLWRLWIVWEGGIFPKLRIFARRLGAGS